FARTRWRVSGESASGWVGATLNAGLADGVSAGCLRGRRRVVSPDRGPYPTSTDCRSCSGADCGSDATVFGATEPHSVPGPTSIGMIGAPTSTVSPSPACSAVTTPAYGDGNSTAALAVSTSTMIWLTVTVSPGLTCQVMMSASVSPSPTSGILKSLSSG